MVFLKWLAFMLAWCLAMLDSYLLARTFGLWWLLIQVPNSLLLVFGAFWGWERIDALFYQRTYLKMPINREYRSADPNSIEINKAFSKD